MKPLWIRKIWDSFHDRFPSLAYDIQYLRRYTRYEPDLWLIPNYCRQTARAIDVGGNMGLFARWMGKHSGQVECFECNPQLFPHLRKVLPGNVALHQCALSSAPGRTSLRFDPANTGIGTIEERNLLTDNPGIRNVKTVEVEMRRLDDFSFASVSFIKIDVEGHEMEVLMGARELLMRNRPTLLIEIEERHCPGNLEAVPRWLRQFGYDAHVLGREGLLAPVTDLRECGQVGIINYWFLANTAGYVEISKQPSEYQ